MLILSSLVIMLTIGIIFLYHSNSNDANDAFEIIGFLVTFISSVFFLVAILFFPIHIYDVHAQIQAYHATVSTIEAARLNGVDIEDAAMQHKIIEINRDIAKLQYYNETIFDIWIPDEVMDLQLIK